MTPLIEKINDALKKAERLIYPNLPLPDLDLVIAASPQQTIPETGVGGHSYTPHLTEIYIDPTSTHMDCLSKELLGTIAHELHHVAREHSVGYGKTLLEACVSEGLADHFEMKITDFPPRLWDKAIGGEELERLRARAEKVWNLPEYNHSAWFFGSGSEGLPRWGGYSLGFDIVAKYLAKIGKTASEAYNTPARDFI